VRDIIRSEYPWDPEGATVGAVIERQDRPPPS